MDRMMARKDRSAFTMVEVLVAIAVLALLVAMIGQLFINATDASSISSNHMESDARVRQLFARMAADFSHILKRTDVDYYLKSPPYTYWPYPVASPPQTSANLQLGNDQMAFFSEVSGYSDDPSNTVKLNSASLVAYRIDNTGTAPAIQRMGKALAWSGDSGTVFPIAFLPNALISTSWPTATNATADQDYETLVPNAFRFEYYYQLHNGKLSSTPWITPTNSALNGLADVAGIGVVVAVTDRKSSVLVSTASLQTLAGTMPDFTDGLTVGGLQTSWQAKVAASALPSAVKNGIRVYEQVFSIDIPSQ